MLAQFTGVDWLRNIVKSYMFQTFLSWVTAVRMAEKKKGPDYPTPAGQNAGTAQHKACHNEWDLDSKIYVGGLGEEGNRLELEEAFSKFGHVKNIWCAKAPPSFAYIEMAVSSFITWTVRS